MVLASNRAGIQVERMNLSFGIALAFLLWGAAVLGQNPEPVREWKTAEGKTFQAAVVSYDGRIAVFRMPNGSKAQGHNEHNPDKAIGQVKPQQGADGN